MIPDGKINAWAIRWGIPIQALVELTQALAPNVTIDSNETNETAVQNKLRLLAPKINCHLWRNNNGAAIDEKGRHIRYGLANDSKRINKKFKSSDLIGITPVSINGQIVGVFTAIEVKKPGFTHPQTEREIAQSNYLECVNTAGGIGIFATSNEDYTNSIERYVKNVQ